MLSKKVASALAAIAVLFLIAEPVTIAEEEENVEENAQIVEIVMLPQVTPPPPPDPVPEVKQWEHDQDDVELLARFLWISPLRSKEEKKTLLWVVFNRVDDQSGMFGNTIDTVCTQSEFAWFDNSKEIASHDLSENRAIVREAMDEWVSEAHGYYAGRHVPACGVWQEFTGYKNREVVVYKERNPADRTEPLRW